MTFFSKVVLTAMLAYGIYKPTRTHTVLHIKIKNIWLYCPHRDNRLLQKALPTQESFFIGFLKRRVAFPAGFEPTAPELGILCSIHLSYGNRPLSRLYP